MSNGRWITKRTKHGENHETLSRLSCFASFVFRAFRVSRLSRYFVRFVIQTPKRSLSPQLLQTPPYLLQLPVRDGPQIRCRLVHRRLDLGQANFVAGRRQSVRLLRVLPNAIPDGILSGFDLDRFQRQ